MSFVFSFTLLNLYICHFETFGAETLTLKKFYNFPACTDLPGILLKCDSDVWQCSGDSLFIALDDAEDSTLAFGSY